MKNFINWYKKICDSLFSIEETEAIEPKAETTIGPQVIGIIPGEPGLIENCAIEVYEDGIIITGGLYLEIKNSTIINRNGEETPAPIYGQIALYTNEGSFRVSDDTFGNYDDLDNFSNEGDE